MPQPGKGREVGALARLYGPFHAPSCRSAGTSKDARSLQALSPKQRSTLARLAGGLLIAAVFAAHALHMVQLPLVGSLENLAYDGLIRRQAQTVPASEAVVILDIDEKSLASEKLGRWPWSRDKVSELTSLVFDHYGAAVLSFDVVFAEPDRSSGLDSLKALAEGELKANPDFQRSLKRLEPLLDFDGRFEETIAARPVVMGYYFSYDAAAGRSGALPAPVLLADDLAGVDISTASPKGFGANLDRFAAAALVGGHFNPVIDLDGIVRRVPALIEFEGDYYESLALASARLYWAIRSNPAGSVLRLQSVEALGPENLPKGRLEFLRVGKQVLPVDHEANILIPYGRFGGTFRYVSVLDVLEKKVPVEALSDKVLVVGTTAPGLVDLRATPLSGIFPGVEVHANVISALIEPERAARIPHHPSWIELVERNVTAFGSVLFAALLAFMAPGFSTLVLAGGFTGVAGAQLWLWGEGLIFQGATLLLALVSIYLWNMAYGYFVEARTKRQFADLFGQYVPPELVEKMAENPERYDMSGRRKELTVLFSDVRGFTSISEQLSPTDLAVYINEYLTGMSMVIRNEGGTLDKYIGDAIMAFWGAPVDEPRHPVAGVTAALRMREELKRMIEAFRARGWPELAIGVGLSSGDMTVGDMGSKVRKAYTVMGDAVNLGSRLEGLTKQYGAFCLVPSATREACKEIVFREMDTVRVKGKAEPVTIYEPECFASDASDTLRKELDLWHATIRLMRAQRWDEALSELSLLEGVLRSEQREDHRVGVLREKIERLRAFPPGADWDGVTNFETK